MKLHRRKELFSSDYWESTGQARIMIETLEVKIFVKQR